MDIYWYGQACFKLKGKTGSVILDPFSPEATGLRLAKDLEANVVLRTHDHPDHNNVSVVNGSQMVFGEPGEYEIKGMPIIGINSDHDSTEGSQKGKNTIFTINVDGLNIVHLGDLGQAKLTETQLTAIGQTDILLIPVGGVYTINSKQAAEIIAQLEPKIVIPMHYFVEGLKIQLDPVDNFLKEMGSEAIQPIPKLVITKEKLPEEMEVVVLSRV